MASYATVPAEADAEKPLLNRDARVNLKTVIGGAAVASFVLGALAAAVVSGAPHGIRRREVVPKHLQARHLHGRMLGSRRARSRRSGKHLPAREKNWSSAVPYSLPSRPPSHVDIHP